ncbi:UDP-N-acetylmuramoyl-L-alanyl-D-glutamate--2,6-diaminopimelate ligase [Kordiimonas sp. SCSIO 12610]|uniref:UDP-N-acetylmuramoyl-L-alanyl-D-glutamate--2, 6-diaminopimelate ligase n=1 Tax=Kordiimonas sp. SCSIO 12610 TaxID=2829597 RepID=UPI002109B337|nr:UDP-N-acetylmuramoyl-L-alanyl-D-glutamate--2,6-diaminopimelate ligase [Kordiimonas sp. SCSIO 12610]UTW56405.1 UDP-N-acetylmuramoyl-L-alanyl-D-glutamate--2,6-diaminopimelate ligase [Kordiimonas sp. SCSIO 12610]
MVTLGALLGLKGGRAEIAISGMTADSRSVKSGDIFAALPGVDFDGRDFIDSAIAKGAVAILTTPDLDKDFGDIPVIEDINPRRKYAELAARFYKKQPKTQIAVTGTNGKTSVADFTRQIWSYAGLKAASVGTVGVLSDVLSLPGGLTTPDPMKMHDVLSTLSEKGVDYAALEASSHGLEQYRVDGVKLDAAAFTNLTRDHLDYHGTELNYFYAKARLFGDVLRPGSTAVINVDDKWGRVLEDIVWGRGLKCITVGHAEEATIQISAHTITQKGQAAKLRYSDQEFEVSLPLIGSFQFENAILAAGLAIATGVKPTIAFEALDSLKGVPGRMEFIGENEKGGSVFVDYAHTPDGLKTVLEAARAHNPNHLHVVFGCGGDRDKGKRPQMGKIAADYADCVYVTDDNPRSEDAGVIRSEILAECADAKEFDDRAQAIETAINSLQHGDMLVVAGKGHEEGQILKDKTIEFSDIGTVRNILVRGERHVG